MKPHCPPEIVHKILLHVHRVDLLNSRLVSKSWNNESLSILKNSDYLLDLNETNLGEYIQFSQTFSGTPLLIMNFSVNLTIGKNSHPSEQEQSEVDKFKSAASGIETLQTLFGPKCIHELTFHIHGEAQQLLPLVLQLLTKVTNGLKKLGLSIFVEFLNQDDVFNKLSDLYLPTVESLFMCATLKQNTTFWPKLVEKCPNVVQLQVLGFPKSLSDEGWPLPATLTKVKQLVSTALIPLGYISNKICMNSSFSNLTRLQLCIHAPSSGSQVRVTDLQNMLEHISKTVVTLDFIFYGHMYQSYEDTFLIPSVQFQRLKNLSVDVFGSIKKCPKLKIKSSGFSSLESIGLHYCIGIKVEVTNDTETDTNTDYPFPKVKRLGLYVHENPRQWIPGVPYKDHMEHLQNIFNHVSMVVLINSDFNCPYVDGRFCGSKIQYVLQGIIQSAGSTKITQLTLQDFPENYLAMVLNQIYNPPRLIVENLPRNYFLDTKLKEMFQKVSGGINFFIIDEKGRNEEDDQDSKTIVVQQCTENQNDMNKMLNLKKIRLILDARQKSTWNNCIGIPSDDDTSTTENLMDTPRLLYMKTLVKSFPLLEEIEVSSFMFGIDAKVRSQILEKIAKEYPNVVIDVI